MRILMINKFLYPNGGAETYIFKLGDYLKSQGHEVQYFGMEHEGRCVGNHVNAYTSTMDFHRGTILSKITYPVKTIYSREARIQIRKVLDDFNPDVCHLNNFNYQLTPSVILEIRRYEKETGNKIKIIFTAHDHQLVCPNHLMKNPVTGELCMKCLGGHYFNCVKGKCIHGSLVKSFIGFFEAKIWNGKGVYKEIDEVICPSYYLADKLETNPYLKDKIRVIHNFINIPHHKVKIPKEDYVLYFGRYSYEKGVGTLLEVIDELPDIPFVFAGNGFLAEEVSKRKNIINMGFLSGEELGKTIAAARFAVIPSEWPENCPFAVMESQMYGTPVLGADVGGIPELIQDGVTGELFCSGDKNKLRDKIEKLWRNATLTETYHNNCGKCCFDSIEKYYEKLMNVYLERDICPKEN